MPAKKGSKPVYVDGPVYAAFRARLKAEGWTWGITKKVEVLLKDYVADKIGYLGKDVVGQMQEMVADKPRKNKK